MWASWSVDGRWRRHVAATVAAVVTAAAAAIMIVIAVVVLGLLAVVRSYLRLLAPLRHRGRRRLALQHLHAVRGRGGGTG